MMLDEVDDRLLFPVGDKCNDGSALCDQWIDSLGHSILKLVGLKLHILSGKMPIIKHTVLFLNRITQSDMLCITCLE